jgi:hypothetical protein
MYSWGGNNANFFPFRKKITTIKKFSFGLEEKEKKSNLEIFAF